MSGPRPTHLSRRGAVYVARFRIPSDLVSRLGVAEVRKSLKTYDLAVARRRCLAAAAWFERMMETVRTMSNFTRANLEAAAVAYFRSLCRDLDKPRDIPDDYFDQTVGMYTEASLERVEVLQEQLATNSFDQSVMNAAAELIEQAGSSMQSLAPDQRLMAMQLAARAVRAQQLRYVHSLKQPWAEFDPNDPLFADNTVPAASATGGHPMVLSSAIDPSKFGTLQTASEEFIRYTMKRKVGQSHITELKRTLGWLGQVFGPDRPLATISKPEMRVFRDDLERLDIRLRGINAEFRDRLTNDPEYQLKSVTTLRYWRATQAFFNWCCAELSLPENPTLGLKMHKKKGEEPDTPEAMSPEELKALWSTPVFTGHRLKRYREPGPVRLRGAHFWTGIIPYFTGVRAGELSQLLPTDFHFDCPYPHFELSTKDGDGLKTKSLKNKNSERGVPIAKTLLELGLREFVEWRAAKYPKQRVFEGMRLGTLGRKSEGMTQFWGSYLRHFKLWTPGRATHVARHTVIGRLRALGVISEDVGYIVGHRPRDQTGKYGPKELERPANTLSMLDYGFDVVATVGGPFDRKVHLPGGGK